MTSAERGEIKTVLEDRGLRVTSFCYPLMDNNPNSPCKHMRAYTKDRYREIIDFAGELRCRNVCIIPGVVTKLIDPPFEWARDWFVEALDELGEHAQGVGVDLAVENVPFALLPTVDQCLDAIERCGRDNVGMNYDVCNAVCVKEDPADGIRKIGKDRLCNVHISDTPRDRMLHARLGTGVVDPAPIAQGVERDRLRRAHGDRDHHRLADRGERPRPGFDRQQPDSRRKRLAAAGGVGSVSGGSTAEQGDREHGKRFAAATPSC